MKRTEQGFSLVEVLMALSTFAIAATAVASLMFHSTEAVSGNNFASQAVTCAQGELEHLRALAYEELTDSSDECAGDGMDFAIASQVLEDDLADGTKTIIVTVTWTEKGESKSYAIQTIYTKVAA